jgi:type II secretion system protein N
MRLLKNPLNRIRLPQAGLVSYLRRGFPLWGLCGFVVAFLLGFVLYFPLDPVARKVESQLDRQAHLTLQIVAPGWGFPPGISADSVTFTTAAMQGEEIRLSDLLLTPLWSSLLSSNPGISATAKLFSGDLAVSARKQGQVDLQLTGAKLMEQKLSPQLSVLISVQNGDLQFTGVLPASGSNQSQAILALQQIELSGMSALGAGKDILSAGSLQLTAELKGPIVTLESLQLSGGELEISGSGTLTLASRPQASRLNLSLLLKPGAGLDPQLRDLLGLLSEPEADGSIKLRLLGSLAAPRLR